MYKHEQNRAPIYEAQQNFKKMLLVPYADPGHKRGRGNPELVELLGERCVGIDVNSMKPLDNLCHPVSVIKEAEELAAEAFGAAGASAASPQNSLVDGVQLTFKMNGRIFNTAQVGQMREFKYGPAIMTSTGPPSTRIQPNNPYGCKR